MTAHSILECLALAMDLRPIPTSRTRISSVSCRSAGCSYCASIATQGRARVCAVQLELCRSGQYGVLVAYWVSPITTLS
jgi:hypothetical protein